MIHFKVYDKWGRCITAHEDNWQHAVEGHPELSGHENVVMTCMVNPEQLCQSDTSTQTKLYLGPVVEQGIFAGATPVTVVHYGTLNTGVWKTGYFTSLPPELKVLWKKS